ncbi:DUF1622 domain-containing protein [Polymorphospora sp. NPDC050346]|uniref:DUF1622 domain-containing protein n=1 Tax=Polymorphospora sp. NPDC050346 TaxID=3155780 RepID=UPI0033DFE6EF
MSAREVIQWIGGLLDLAGVLVIAVGVLVTSVAFLRGYRRDRQRGDAYRSYRQGVGRAILLGLELLVAGDIIRTVAVSPTFHSVGVLALIVVVRTLLSFTLEVELEGRWPWQSRAARSGPSPEAAAPGDQSPAKPEPR